MIRKISAAEVYEEVVNYNDSSPKTLFTLPANTAVIDAFVQVTTAFDDATATVDIGDDSDPDGIIPNSSLNLTATGFQALKESEKGAYLWDGTYKQIKVYDSNTDIKSTINPGSSTQGQLKVFVVILDIRYL